MRQPTFAEFPDGYPASRTHTNKRLNARKAERLNLGYWKAHLGECVSADQPGDDHAYREKRLSQDVKARTIQRTRPHLYAALNYAVERGVIDGFQRVNELSEQAPPKRRLLEPVDIEALLSHSTPDATKNHDLLRLDRPVSCAYRSAREGSLAHSLGNGNAHNA